MCRNIRLLFNLDPTATADEARDAALQYVRKVSGQREPSAANRAAFDHAVEQIAAATTDLLGGLVTAAPARDREVLAAQARARSAARYGGAG